MLLSITDMTSRDFWPSWEWNTEGKPTKFTSLGEENFSWPVMEDTSIGRLKETLLEMGEELISNQSAKFFSRDKLYIWFC